MREFLEFRLEWPASPQDLPFNPSRHTASLACTLEVKALIVMLHSVSMVRFMIELVGMSSST